MAIRKKDDRDPLDFTEEEVAASRSDLVPAEIQRFMAKNHDEAGGRARYYRKVAALASAETMALLAIRERNLVHAELQQEAALREQLKLAEQRTKALEAQLSAKDQKINQLTAGPAMVVHSDD